MEQTLLVLDKLLESQLEGIVEGWLKELTGTTSGGSHGVRAEAREFLQAFHRGVHAQGGNQTVNVADPAWSEVRGFLEGLSRSRAAQGFTAGDTSHFILSVKKPLFDLLQQQLLSEPARLLPLIWAVTSLVDKLAQLTVTAYQITREDIISRQQQDLLELSTPVVKLWDGVLAVPMIGTLDSGRSQVVMESLLQRIVETGSELAIIDITGVPTVDTLVAQHLLKTVTAIRLMGADCIISGIRPQIAQTIVHLGIDLQGITTKATLADALSLALKRAGYSVTRGKPAA
ncbi:MAG: STAS domain-containing protein [Rubrivivax sp.]|nr:MAG: STAS domain-containing protein [Rubrivivax sp.]